MSSKPRTLLTVISIDTLPESSQYSPNSVSKIRSKIRTLPLYSKGTSTSDVVNPISHIKYNSEESINKLYVNRLQKHSNKQLQPLKQGASENRILNTISNNKIIQSEKSGNSLQTSKLQKIFKNNFYEDVTPATLVKGEKNISFKDKCLLNQVIHMNKIATFWKCFCHYSNPIISSSRTRSAKNEIQERIKSREQINYNIYQYQYQEKQRNNRYVLYTNSSIFEKHHRNKIQKEKEFYLRMKYQ